MKKNYNSPKAEKMEFNYSETVVASVTTKCHNETHYTDGNDQGEYCMTNQTYHKVGDVL